MKPHEETQTGEGKGDAGTCVPPRALHAALTFLLLGLRQRTKKGLHLRWRDTISLRGRGTTPALPPGLVLPAPTSPSSPPGPGATAGSGRPRWEPCSAASWCCSSSPGSSAGPAPGHGRRRGWPPPGRDGKGYGGEEGGRGGTAPPRGPLLGFLRWESQEGSALMEGAKPGEPHGKRARG